MSIKSIIDKYKIPIAAFVIFALVGIVMWLIRDVRYFYLFAGIGLAEFSTRIVIIHHPKLRQFFRLTIQFLLGSMFIFWLSLFIGVNFQFPEIFFDASAGIVTGALIQMLVARVILPFFFGNAFCSRACWTGFFFEMTNSKENTSKPPKKRSEKPVLPAKTQRRKVYSARLLTQRIIPTPPGLLDAGPGV